MRTTYAMLGAIAALTIGTFAAAPVQAQQSVTASAPAYYISEFTVTDRDGMKPYSARVESTFQPFGGCYIVRGGRIAGLEGDGPKGGVVIIAFDSMEKAQTWYDSPAYRELRPIRHKAATSRIFIVEGTPR